MKASQHTRIDHILDRAAKARRSGKHSLARSYEIAWLAEIWPHLPLTTRLRIAFTFLTARLRRILAEIPERWALRHR